jgi:hypothetical protein
MSQSPGRIVLPCASITVAVFGISTLEWSSLGDPAPVHQYGSVWNGSLACAINQRPTNQSERLGPASGNSFGQIGKSGHVVSPCASNKGRKRTFMIFANGLEMIEFSIYANLGNQVLVSVEPEVSRPQINPLSV